MPTAGERNARLTRLQPVVLHLCTLCSAESTTARKVAACNRDANVRGARDTSLHTSSARRLWNTRARSQPPASQWQHVPAEHIAAFCVT
jgi:hypothetical protein